MQKSRKPKQRHSDDTNGSVAGARACRCLQESSEQQSQEVNN